MAAADGPAAAAASGSTAADAAPVLARVILGAGPADASALHLSIGSVDNPGRAPVSLAVSIVEAGPPARVHPVGVVSLFPADRPGRFVLRLPASWRPPRPVAGHASMPPAMVLLEAVGTAAPGWGLGDVRARLVAEPR